MTVIKQYDGIGDPADPDSWDTVLVGTSGAPGAKGDTGDIGPAGADGAGVPSGGITGDVLTKASGVDHDTEWVAVSGSGVADGDKGDIIVSAAGSLWSLDPSVVTTFARTLLDDVSYADMRTTIGAAPLTTLSTTAPLTGGGDLSANRTLAIDEFAGTTPGAVPTSAGGTTDFLRADGEWATPGGGSFQPLDADLTTIAGLTATTDNIIQSVGSTWASRTPSQVKTALAITQADVTSLVTDLAAKQPLDSDLTTISGLTATTDNFMVSVSSAWASRTPAQVKTTLSLNNVDNTSDASKPVSTATQTALDLKQNKTQTIVPVATTTYTLLLTDAGCIITFSNASAITVTVPTNAAVAFPIGTSIDMIQLLAGQFTVTGAGPPTISKSMATAKSRAQYSVMTLIKIATDIWVLTGDAAAS